MREQADHHDVVVQRDRLGADFAEDDEQHGDDHGGREQRRTAGDQLGRDRRTDRRRAGVDEVVAEQDGSEQASGFLEQGGGAARAGQAGAARVFQPYPID